MRYRRLGLLTLGVVAGLVLAWPQLSHLWFAICAVVIGTMVMGLLAAWDGMLRLEPSDIVPGRGPANRRSFVTSHPRRR